jgi:hypothetical protein
MNKATWVICEHAQVEAGHHMHPGSPLVAPIAQGIMLANITNKVAPPIDPTTRIKYWN